MLRGINGMDLILNILTGKIISNVTITNFAIFLLFDIQISRLSPNFFS